MQIVVFFGERDASAVVKHFSIRTALSRIFCGASTAVLMKTWVYLFMTMKELLLALQFKTNAI